MISKKSGKLIGAEESKKGVELSLNVIVIAIIVLAVLAVVLLVFGRYIGIETCILGVHIGSLETDYDHDGVKDAVDPCPCDKDILPPCKTQCNYQDPCSK